MCCSGASMQGLLPRKDKSFMGRGNRGPANAAQPGKVRLHARFQVPSILVHRTSKTKPCPGSMRQLFLAPMPLVYKDEQFPRVMLATKSVRPASSYVGSQPKIFRLFRVAVRPQPRQALSIDFLPGGGSSSTPTQRHFIAIRAEQRVFHRIYRPCRQNFQSIPFSCQFQRPLRLSALTSRRAFSQIRSPTFSKSTHEMNWTLVVLCPGTLSSASRSSTL